MVTFEKVLIITGHYGCGKTNLAVNIALDLAKQGKPVTVVDLDIVNPYFRTYDFKELFEQKGIEVIAPNFAATNLDIPSLPGSIQGLFLKDDRYLVIDVGGDDAGAIALGQYAALIQKRPYEMLYVFNPNRYLTANPEEAAGLLRGIEGASRVRATGLVNNANLGEQTTAQTVMESLGYGRELSGLTGLPIKFLACANSHTVKIEGLDVFEIDVHVKTL